MWYFIVCIATPLNVQCTSPQVVASQADCSVLDEAYRGAAQTLHDKSRTLSRCVAVPPAGTAPPSLRLPGQITPPIIDVPLPNLGVQ